MKKCVLMWIAVIISVWVLSGCASQFSQANVIAQEGRFVAYNDGTVLDKDRGLMWAARDNGAPITWEEAKGYCGNFKAGGYTDWRMPTQDELTDLYDARVTNTTPPADGCKGGCHLTNFIHLSCCPVWYWNGIDEVPGFFHFAVGPKDWRDQSLETYSPRALPVRQYR
ncbi:MAG: DUF1566 domain-containing protein [Deltaproteobacteria bacterium]